MSVFKEWEVEYLGTQRLGRLATVDAKGNPHVVPVGFHYNPETDTIDIGGHSLGTTHKWAHIKAHSRVAFVVDDVLPSWRPRFIEIKAEAELLEGGGQNLNQGFSPELIRLRAVRINTFGLGPDENVATRPSNVTSRSVTS